MKLFPTLNGLHHVTAITSNASANLDFYSHVLGLRLVKKTVNQDDLTAYHLFYADAVGSPGTEMTFFNWAPMHPRQPGAGTINETAFRVGGGTDTLNLWIRWFMERNVPHGAIEPYGSWTSIPFQDPEGQQLRLIAEPGAPGQLHPWKGNPLPLEAAIVGLHSVSLTVSNYKSTARFLTEVLGFRSHPDVGWFKLGEGGPQLRLLTSPTPGATGAGGVHHVAWTVPDLEQQQEWLEHLSNLGVPTSGLINRFYFQSVYFRIPGGILFELATRGPGFTADGEQIEHLGERLSLPPFLEKQRAEIEAGLQPL